MSIGHRETEEGGSMPCWERWNAAVKFGLKQCAVVRLDVAGYRKVATANEVQRPVHHYQQATARKLLSKAAFLLAHPFLQLLERSVRRGIGDRADGPTPSTWNAGERFGEPTSPYHHSSDSCIRECGALSVRDDGGPTAMRTCNAAAAGAGFGIFGEEPCFRSPNPIDERNGRRFRRPAHMRLKQRPVFDELSLLVVLIGHYEVG